MLLVTVVTLGLFAGCGAEDNKGKEESQVSQPSESEVKESEVQESEVQEEEVNLFEEEVNLIYCLPLASDEYAGFGDIVEELNKITKEKINATVTVEMIPLGEYTDKMQMKFASGEEWDVCFTGLWNPYLDAVNKGAYAELTEEVLNTYAPEFMAQINPGAWEACSINGKIYGAPIEQIYVRQTGLRFATDLTDKYGFDYTAVKTFEDLDDYLATIKENEPEAVPFMGASAILDYAFSYMGFDAIAGNGVPGVVYFDAETPVVVNQYASEEFMEVCKKMREWNLAGYFPADIITGSDSVGQQTVRAVDLDPAYKPGGTVAESQLRGYAISEIGIGNAALTTGSVQATMTAVSANSENVERAVAFINLLNTDEDVLNLLCHGIEGVDYQFVGDGSDRVIEMISGYPGIYSFFVGCVFNEYYTDPTQVGTWEETREINGNAPASCIMGFVFNSEPVATEIAQCNTVVSEYAHPIQCGEVDTEEAIATLLEKLEEAGASKVMAEMQKQIDAWVATR